MASQATPRTVFIDALVAQLAEARAACTQPRTHQRLVLLSLALLTSLGRHTITQLLVTLGVGDADWSAWYRLFNAPRVRMDRLGRQTVVTLVDRLERHAPLVVALDATHLYRSGKQIPGTGWVRAAATAVFRRGLARAGLGLRHARAVQARRRPPLLGKDQSGAVAGAGTVYFFPPA